MVKTVYKPGDKVFAKVKGYPPWPAQIVSDTGKKKYNVLFYGTQETGAIKPEDIVYYLKFKDRYAPKYQKRIGYEDAIKQIDEAVKKDGGDGSTGTDDSGNDIDLSMSDASSVSSVSEKKVTKRKTSLADESPVKKTPARGRRKSAASESKEDNQEEPAIKKARRGSNASTGSKGEAETKSKKPTDNGLKTDNIDEVKETIKEEKAVTESESDADTTIKAETTGASEAEQAKKGGDKGKETKDPAFVEVKVNDSSAAESAEEAEDVKVEIVTEQCLNHNILYAEHVKKNPDAYKEKPVEPRQDNKNDVLPVKLPSGTICGLKLHKVWPLKYENEYDRALYDEQVARLALKIKDLLQSGESTIKEVDLKVVSNIHMTIEDIKEISYARDIENKRKRLERLKKEAALVTWDAKIKSSLGLDKALPDVALEALKEFSGPAKSLDLLMLMKHPHVLDTVRRLRKYVGNTKEWDMNEDDIDDFTKKAEKIRNEAENIYNKIKNIVKLSEEKGTFWDTFMKLVADFRTKCKELKENEVLVLCAEPDSRQAFLDKLDEVIDSEGANAPSINASNNSEPVLKETSVQGWSEKK